MHRLLYFTLSLLIISFIGLLFLPWYVIAFIAFGIGYYFEPGGAKAFIWSFMTLFVLWTAKAWFADKNFDNSMAALLGQILGNLSSSTVLFLTGFIAGVVGGIFGLLGNWTKKLL